MLKMNHSIIIKTTSKLNFIFGVFKKFDIPCIALFCIITSVFFLIMTLINFIANLMFSFVSLNECFILFLI